MRRVRVAHVITRLCQGGAQRNTVHSVQWANGSRFEVDLISGPVPEDEPSMEDEVEAAGIKIHGAPTLCRRPSLLRDVTAYTSLVRLFRSKSYDIVHTHTSKAGFIGRVAARRAGVPVIVHTPHGNIFHGYFSRPVTALYVAMERYAAGLTDRIVTLTPRGVEEHLEKGIGRREQYTTIFSGIDFGPFEKALEERENMRAQLGVSGDAILVGGVGRLEPIKGFRYFVESAFGIRDAVAEAQFVLAGKGSCEDELKALAKPLGDSFRFLGHRNDIPGLMAAMDVLVAPSLNEGMGRVIVEAGAARKTCVASAVGGIPDVVDDGVTGVLVEPRHVEELVKAVVGLARDRDRRQAMGEAARRRAVAKYSVERMVRQIEELYEELILEKGLRALAREGEAV